MIFEGYLGIRAGYRDPTNNFSSTDPNYYDQLQLMKIILLSDYLELLNIFINSMFRNKHRI